MRRLRPEQFRNGNLERRRLHTCGCLKLLNFISLKKIKSCLTCIFAFELLFFFFSSVFYLNKSQLHWFLDYCWVSSSNILQSQTISNCLNVYLSGGDESLGQGCQIGSPRAGLHWLHKGKNGALYHTMSHGMIEFDTHGVGRMIFQDFKTKLWLILQLLSWIWTFFFLQRLNFWKQEGRLLKALKY